MKRGLAAKSGTGHLGWAVALAAWLSAPVAWACSTVALGSGEATVVAYSYDTSETGAGFVLVNPAGATRASIMEGDAARWSVTHGSVSFNQFGPGMPVAGLNTAGLMVSLMWNDDAVFPPVDGRPKVNELEFIQRLLDRAANVDEALSMLDEVGIEALVPIHFFMADAEAATAAITPEPGGFVVHTGEAMPVPALTNSRYADLVSGLSDFDGFGGDRPLPAGGALDDPGSMARFVIAARAASGQATPELADAWPVLEGVQNPQSHWQIVFRPAARSIEFRLVGQAGQWRIDMAALDFSCQPVPFGRGLSGLSADGDVALSAPVDPAEMTNVIAEVLSGFQAVAGLPPEVAGPIVEAQLASVMCDDQQP